MPWVETTDGKGQRAAARVVGQSQGDHGTDLFSPRDGVSMVHGGTTDARSPEGSM
jgi:predicted NAD/FAD-dependent oxidoreductase